MFVVQSKQQLVLVAPFISFGIRKKVAMAQFSVSTLRLGSCKITHTHTRTQHVIVRRTVARQGTTRNRHGVGCVVVVVAADEKNKTCQNVLLRFSFSLFFVFLHRLNTHTQVSRFRNMQRRLNLSTKKEKLKQQQKKQ